MSLLVSILVRILGPVAVFSIVALLLAPSMSQPGVVFTGVDVSHLIRQQLAPTLRLIALSILLATVIWLPLAVLTARRGYHTGLTMAPLGVLAQALAPFWLGIVGLLLVGAPRLTASVGAVTQAALPAGALAIVLLGLLAHATHLRAVSRHALEVEVDVPAGSAQALRLEIAEDWLDTLGRQAGLMIGALVLIEATFARPGLGRIFVDGLRNADVAVRSVALFDLIALSVALTVLFGIGAEVIRARSIRHRSEAPGTHGESRSVWAAQASTPEPRWLAVLTMASGGLILVVLLILTTSTDVQPMAAQANAALLPPGSPGHVFGTDQLGRDMHARIAAGVWTGLQVAGAEALFAVLFAVPLGLLAARRGRVVEGATSLLIDGGLVVAPLFVVIGGGIVANGPAYWPTLIVAMLLVVARLTRDAVRAVWSGEGRDVQAAFGAMLMSLLVGLSYAVLFEASLSFLGARLPTMGVSLGDLLAAGSLAVARAPWLSIYPGLVLTALASSLILIGYGALGLLRSRPATSAARTHETRQLAEA